MKTNFDCLVCLIRQILDAVRLVTSDQKVIERVMKTALKEAAELDMNKTTAELGMHLHRLIRKETGNADPYLPIKNKANQAAMSVLPWARKQVADARQPFLAAVKFAIAGNIMDFALYTQWNEELFQKNLLDVSSKEIDEEKVAELEQKVLKSGSILLIGDNAGEIVFDRLLLEQFAGKKVYYGVKGGPVINDALAADARFAGIDQYAEIIESGIDGAGTILPFCSEEFRRVFYGADLVISKGQGNYETLSECDREIYFLLQVKCRTVAEDTGQRTGEWLVASNIITRSQK